MLMKNNNTKKKYTFQKKKGSFVLVIDRITATAVNRMLVWQPQPRCGSEYHNRNRVIFFNNRVYFKKFLFKKKFILPILKFEL